MKYFKRFYFLAILVFILACSNIAAISEKPFLIIEVESKNGTKQISFSLNDIDEIGINDTKGVTQIEFIFDKKYHDILESITKENIGHNWAFKTENGILASGPIRSSINDGFVAFLSSSKEEAEKTLKQLGIKKYYYFKHTPEEMEEGKYYLKSKDNPWVEKAMVAQRNKKYSDAEEFAKKAIAMEPDKPTNYSILSSIYFMKGDKEAAFKELIKAESLIKNEDVKKFTGVYIDLGNFYYERREYKAAIEICKKYLSFNNNRLVIHLILAKSYEAIKEFRQALEEYNFIIESGDEYYKEIVNEGIQRINKEMNSMN